MERGKGMLLENKNAMIYGGGGSIGGAVAREFAREGAKVFLAGAAAGGLPILGAAGVKALLDRRDKLREIRDNQLYFYYRAGER